MKPLVEIDRSALADGTPLVLYRREDHFVIQLAGRELMGSRAHASEEQLAALACAGLASVRHARVLIGGLGLGYTARAALDSLGREARVDVAEIVPAVVRWNRDILGHLAGAPMADPRLRVIEEDVADVIAAAEACYDAIMLDVDNGPSSPITPRNARLYDAVGLRHAWNALRPGGVLAVWSTSDDARFSRRLAAAGYVAHVERPRIRPGAGARHVIWLARKRG